MKYVYRVESTANWYKWYKLTTKRYTYLYSSVYICIV